ncbi:MAG: 50S ribosomal protein L31 [bacterium]|nr:50S ribosomal protein L31 [bacterium]
MQVKLHPQFHEDVLVTCSCGKTFTTGSITEKLTVEVCSLCHPLYTGEEKFLDTKGSVDKFLKKEEQAKEFKKTSAAQKKMKKDKQERGSQSLRDLLGQ